MRWLEASPDEPRRVAAGGPLGDRILYVTADELAELSGRVRELVDEYFERQVRPELRPPGARLVTWLHLAFPNDFRAGEALTWSRRCCATGCSGGTGARRRSRCSATRSPASRCRSRPCSCCTPGAAQMGYLTALEWLPSLLFGLHAGAWVDRRGRRRRTMIAADLGRAALFASIPVCYALHVLTLPQLYAGDVRARGR